MLRRRLGTGHSGFLLLPLFGAILGAGCGGSKGDEPRDTPAVRFSISADVDAVAGDTITLTISALDEDDAVVEAHSGRVTLSSSDEAAVLPADGAFVADDSGKLTLEVVLKTAGTQTITVQDASKAELTGSLDIDVSPAAASTIWLTDVEEPIVAGDARAIGITLSDAFGNRAITHSGTLSFSSSDTAAELPANVVFTAADEGSRTVSGFVFKTAGEQTLHIVDTADAGLTASATFSVVAGEPAAIVVSGLEAEIVAGDEQSVTITAVDTFGNRAGTYTGTLSFSATDEDAELPTDVTFASADEGRRVASGLVFTTAGEKTLTVTDVGNPELTTSATFSVVPGAAASFALAGLDAEVVAGSSQTVGVTVHDAYDNVVTGYTGTIAFSSDDVAATLPVPVTFEAADEGVREVAGIVFATPGAHTLTATDSSDSTIVGITSVTVVPGAPHALFIGSAPEEVFQGDAVTVKVSVQDVVGNVVPGYSGAVILSSTDVSATLPSPITFTEADAGSRTVSGIVLVTSGEQTLTATDSENPALAGEVSIRVIPDVEWMAGTPEEPHVIHTLAGLQAMNQKLDEHYVLGRDIDASPTRTWNPATRQGAVWTRIVGEDYDFQNIISGNAVIFASGRRLVALDAATGKSLWEMFLPLTPEKNSPKAAGFATAEGRLFVGSSNGMVFALDADTGAVVWEYDAGARVFSVLEYFDGRLYFSTFDGEVFVLNAATGELVWKKPIPYEANTILVDGQFVHLASYQSVIALDLDTGDEVWSFDSGASVHSDFVLHDGVLYFGSNKLYGRNAATGEEVVTESLDDEVVTNLLLDGNTIYFAERNKAVSAYDIVEKTFTEAAGTLSQNRLFLSNGTLLVETTTGQLWGVATSGDDKGLEVWTHESLAYREAGRKQLYGNLLIFSSGLGLVQALDVSNEGTPVFLGFEPVGSNGPDGRMVAEEENSEFAFRGGFDGAGYTISGLYIDRPGTNFVGLFGFARDATLANVRLTNATISGGRTTGVLVGDLWGGSVTNAHASGDVSGVRIVGGLLGGSTNGAISKSSASTRVYGRGEGIGGLVGGLDGTASVSSSFATGAVIGAKDESNSGEGVGGLVGGSGGAATLSDCYSTGDVRGTTITGGLYGAAESGTPTIERCYASGNVVGQEVVGGLVGGSASGSTLSISNSFTTATVSGGFINGAVIGGALSEFAFENLRWLARDTDEEQCMIVPSASEDDCAPVDASTHADYFFHIDNMPMSASGDGWDFDTVWSRSRDGTGYPILKWQE